MKKLIILLVLVVASQGIEAKKPYKPVGIGAGIGLNYGGQGLNLAYAPSKRLAFFGYAGYNEMGFNYGGGANLYLLFTKKRKFRPNIKALYGSTNTISGSESGTYDKSYYGFMLGIGNEIRFGKGKAYGLDVDVLFPFKSDEYLSALDVLNNSSGMTFTDSFKKAAWSFSLHVDIGRKKK